MGVCDPINLKKKEHEDKQIRTRTAKIKEAESKCKVRRSTSKGDLLVIRSEYVLSWFALRNKCTATRRICNSLQITF